MRRRQAVKPAPTAPKLKERHGRKPANIDGVSLPVSPQDRLFCERWLEHYDTERAYREAGFINNHANAAKKMRKYALYLSRLKEKKEQAVIKALVLDQSDILHAMMRVAYANPMEYELMEEMKVDGKPLTQRRMKYLHELTRDQALAVDNVRWTKKGAIYDLPSLTVRHTHLKDLGQHVGLFHPKLIQEHRHAHLHAIVPMQSTDPQKLAAAEAALVAVLGPQALQWLGVPEPVVETEEG